MNMIRWLFNNTVFYGKIQGFLFTTPYDKLTQQGSSLGLYYGTSCHMLLVNFGTGCSI